MTRASSAEKQAALNSPWWLTAPRPSHVPDAAAAARALLRRSGWVQRSTKDPAVYISPIGARLHLQAHGIGDRLFEAPRTALSGQLVMDPGGPDELVQTPNPDLTASEQTALVWSWIQLHGNGYRPTDRDQLTDWLASTAVNPAVAETGYPRVQWNALGRRAADSLSHRLLAGDPLPDFPPLFLEKPWRWTDSALAAVAVVFAAAWCGLLSAYLLMRPQLWGDFALAVYLAGASVLGMAGLAAFTMLRLTQVFGLTRLACYHISLTVGRFTGRGWRHGLKYVTWAEQSCRHAPMPAAVLGLRASFGPLEKTARRAPLRLSGVNIDIAGPDYAYLSVAEDIAAAIERIAFGVIPQLKPPGGDLFRQTIFVPLLTALAWQVAEAMAEESTPTRDSGPNDSWEQISQQVSALFGVYMTLLSHGQDSAATKSVVTELMRRQPQPLEPWQPAVRADDLSQP